MTVYNPKPWPFKGTVWTVSADGYADFTDLQEAIDTAVAGDVVLVGGRIVVSGTLTLKAGVLVSGLVGSDVETGLPRIILGGVGSLVIPATAGVVFSDLTLQFDTGNLAAGTHSVISIQGFTAPVFRNVFFVFNIGSGIPYFSGGAVTVNCILVGDGDNVGGQPALNIVGPDNGISVFWYLRNILGEATTARLLVANQASSFVVVENTELSLSNLEDLDVGVGIDIIGPGVGGGTDQVHLTNVSINPFTGIDAPTSRDLRIDGFTGNSAHCTRCRFVGTVERILGNVILLGGNIVPTFIGDADADNTVTVVKTSYGVVHTDGQDSQYKVALRNLAGDVATPADGNVWYNAITEKLRTQENGVIKDVVSAAAPGALTVGQTTVNFGAFPGGNEASVAVAQPGVGATTIAWAFLKPEATIDHSADEHYAEGPWIEVAVTDIVVGVGFTIKAIYDNPRQQPLRFPGINRGPTPGLLNGLIPPVVNPSVGGESLKAYGLWTVAWAWTNP